MSESKQHYSLLYEAVSEYIHDNHEGWVLGCGYSDSLIYITKRGTGMYISVNTMHNHITVYYHHHMSPINSFRHNSHELLEAISNAINKVESSYNK